MRGRDEDDIQVSKGQEVLETRMNKEQNIKHLLGQLTTAKLGKPMNKYAIDIL